MTNIHVSRHGDQISLTFEAEGRDPTIVTMDSTLASQIGAALIGCSEPNALPGSLYQARANDDH